MLQSRVLRCILTQTYELLGGAVVIPCCFVATEGVPVEGTFLTDAGAPEACELRDRRKREIRCAGDRGVDSGKRA